MTAGKVIEVLDGIPENVPHSGKIAIDVNFFNAGGNHVVVDIGYGLYALYAHMRPGTLKVKVGDEVNSGDILGHLGNSGNSTEPHLHAHIVDRPSFLAGQGVPYEFQHFEATDATQYVAKPHDQMFFNGIGELSRSPTTIRRKMRSFRSHSERLTKMVLINSRPCADGCPY
jgi:hypothetical protein